MPIGLLAITITGCVGRDAVVLALVVLIADLIGVVFTNPVRMALRYGALKCAIFL